MSRETRHREWIRQHGVDAECPYCHSRDTERCGAFGAFHMTEPYVCRECGSPFNRIRWQGPGE